MIMVHCSLTLDPIVSSKTDLKNSGKNFGELSNVYESNRNNKKNYVTNIENSSYIRKPHP